MLGTIDLRSVQKDSSDLDLLQAYLQQLVGQPFLAIRFSYGDELAIHFGETRPYSSPKMKHLTKGAYILGARGSQWRLRSEAPPAIIVGSGDDKSASAANLKPLSKADLESGAFFRPGTLVVHVHATPVTSVAGFSAYALSLAMADGTSLFVSPVLAEPHELADEPLADWELFTPYERLLRVGPGLQWCYMPTRRDANAAQT
jgi:hypothetical protein